MTEFSRLEMLYGATAVHRLQEARILIFGIGGVGGYVTEALARSGVGHLDLVDHDTVELSNLNRQIIALHSTIGRLKVEVMKERILDIDPACEVHAYPCFYLPDNHDAFDFSQYDYIVDCVDTITAKIDIIMQAKACRVPVISAMGAGNKVHPDALQTADLFQTEMDPLAKVMRRELKKRGIKHLKVVYSKEKPIKPAAEPNSRKPVPGSTVFVPGAMGLFMAAEIINDLTK